MGRQGQELPTRHRAPPPTHPQDLLPTPTVLRPPDMPHHTGPLRQAMDLPHPVCISCPLLFTASDIASSFTVSMLPRCLCLGHSRLASAAALTPLYYCSSAPCATTPKCRSRLHAVTLFYFLLPGQAMATQAATHPRERLAATPRLAHTHHSPTPTPSTPPSPGPPTAPLHSRSQRSRSSSQVCRTCDECSNSVAAVLRCAQVVCAGR